MPLYVYTDGACRRNGDGAWAFVAVSHGKEIHAESGKQFGTTNNRMELYAILMALVWISKRPVDNVIIVTDSKYSITVITRPTKANPFPLPKNHDLIQLARKLVGDTQLIWVKGHSGCPWNDRADRLATATRDDNGGLLTVRRAPGRTFRIHAPGSPKQGSTVP
jgi:ribonuclease HI